MFFYTLMSIMNMWRLKGFGFRASHLATRQATLGESRGQEKIRYSRVKKLWKNKPWSVFWVVLSGSKSWTQ